MKPQNLDLIEYSLSRISELKNKNVKLYLKLEAQPWWQCKTEAKYDCLGLRTW
jgi:hypothetical protein